MCGASARGSCSSRTSCAVSRGAPRAGAARPALRRQARQAARRAAGAAQVGAARPANGRRPRQHLRRRGAVAEPAASAARRGQPRPRRARRASIGRSGSVLRKGIERQGSTLRDYALPDGAYGTMQDEFRAYGRGGEPCDRCGRRSPASSSAGARRRSARSARLCRMTPSAARDRQLTRRATSTPVRDGMFDAGGRRSPARAKSDG